MTDAVDVKKYVSACIESISPRQKLSILVQIQKAIWPIQGWKCCMLRSLISFEQKGPGDKGKGEEEDDDEDSLDWWSRYYETVKDIERQEEEDEAKEAQKDVAVTKKDKKGDKEAEAPKRKKLTNPKITRIKVRCHASPGPTKFFVHLQSDAKML